MPRTNPVQLAHVLMASGARMVDRTESQSIAALRSVARAHNVDGWWDWDDDTVPRTDRPVRFYRAFTPGGNSRKYLYPSRIHA